MTIRKAFKSMTLAPFEGPVEPVTWAAVSELAAVARAAGADYVAHQLERAQTYSEPGYPIGRALAAYDTVVHPIVAELSTLQMPWFRHGLAELCRLA